MTVDVRPSPIAGLWYEGDPKVLASTVDNYLELARLPKLEGEVIAVVAPHAGHRYSGPVAGYAFAALRGLKPDLVAILSPFHNPHNAPFLTSAHDSYATPLGAIPIDHAGVESLSAALHSELGFGLTRISNDPEHSLEIELPFLQRVLVSGMEIAACYGAQPGSGRFANPWQTPCQAPERSKGNYRSQYGFVSLLRSANCLNSRSRHACASGGFLTRKGLLKLTGRAKGTPAVLAP